ncbi:MAG: type 4a pilus biogenesis protein PilO, partial [Gemmatimonadota bacterium]
MALGLPDDPAQQRRLLIGLVPLLALFAYWYFLHGTYVEELTAMETRLESLETRNAQARMRAPQSRQLEERLTAFERHIERLEELVPRGEEVSQLLNTISERADQIGVSVARFTPGEADLGTHYNRRTFELTVHGTYHEVGRFLSEIGSLPRIITPIDLSIQRYD